MSTKHPLELLRKKLKESHLDGCIITHTSDIRWLTGWEYVFDAEKAHAAFVTADQALIHTDGRYSAAMRAHVEDGIWQIDDEFVPHSEYMARTLDTIASASVTPTALRIAIEDDLPLNRYRKLKEALSALGQGDSCIELVELGRQVSSFRAVKIPDEIDVIRQAQQISDLVFNKLLDWLQPGFTELEVAAKLEYLLRTNGADGMAFPAIVASGPHSANPHAVPTNRVIETGDQVILDFGARYRDYCADVTRVVFIGTPTKEQRALYDAVRAAQESARALVSPEITGKQVHERALAVLDEHGYGMFFNHAVGHGVGIAVHEEPHLAPNATSVLQAGNVITIEPGAYIPGFGGVRIEDCGLVTQAGFESFTALTHEYIVIS